MCEGLREIYIVKLWDFIWDSFNHMYNLEKYKDIHYISIAEQNEIFSMILCIIDEMIISIDCKPNSDNTPPDSDETDKPQKI